MSLTDEANVRLSIVVATFNAAASLPETLASVRRQGGYRPADVELLLMDGGSTDGTVAIARASGLFAAIISEPDRGVYDAMNKGAALASGRWLQFLNAGDALSDDRALKAVLEAADEADRESRAWFVGRARNLAAGGTLIRSVPHRWVRHAWGLQPHCHQATFVRADVFRALGGHSLEFGTAGDFDFIFRLGMITPPLEMSTLIVDYEGGGMSNVGPRETARLLSRVRRERLQLEGAFFTASERLLMESVVLANRSRISVGRIRQLLRKVVSR